MEAEKEAAERGRTTKKKWQQTLAFDGVVAPSEFTREGILHAVAKLIATNDQVCQLCSSLHRNTNNVPKGPCPR